MMKKKQYVCVRWVKDELQQDDKVFSSKKTAGERVKELNETTHNGKGWYFEKKEVTA